MASLMQNLKHAWNAFRSEEQQYVYPYAADIGSGYSYRPDYTRPRFSTERSIISSIYTRLSIDIAQIELKHVRLDEQDRYLEDMESYLNECLTLEANLDQTAFDLRKDIAMSLFDDGVIAILPIDTTINPQISGSFDIKTIRVGSIKQWYPKKILVSVYNEATGKREELIVDKSYAAIVVNPLYSVMNEPNSTLQRLLRKLTLLDSVDEQSSSGKLDLIIQLPYVIKSEARRQQAEQRRKDIEFQLKGSQYGIAYTDGTEKITQLNRPAENQLMAQVEYLTKMLYGQLGLTEEVMNGTADEKAMLNYKNRTLVPIMTAITQEMKRKFITKTGRTQGQSIEFFDSPFKLIPMSELAEIADKFTRNEIASSNEIRQIVGWKPVQDGKADQLRNSNMPESELGTTTSTETVDEGEEDDTVMQDAFSSLNSTLDEIFSDLGVEE